MAELRLSRCEAFLFGPRLRMKWQGTAEEAIEEFKESKGFKGFKGFEECGEAGR